MWGADCIDARWLNTHKVAGDRNDAGLLMDWKFGYADGALDTWTADDVGEFLFGWCPRDDTTIRRQPSLLGRLMAVVVPA
jgi:hypothetical protein